MKKYFVRLIATLLFFAVLPMIGSFCLADFSFLIAHANTAPVAHDKAIAYDICSQEQANIFNLASTYNDGVDISNHNAILPCCEDSNSPVVISQKQFDKIGKFIPIIFFTDKPLAQLVFKKIAYSSIISSPPELSSIRATILRI
ncbi:MAG: hypothetical protein WAW11_01755 [Patescibacteria group bacterium]